MKISDKRRLDFLADSGVRFGSDTPYLVGQWESYRCRHRLRTAIDYALEAERKRAK